MQPEDGAFADAEVLQVTAGGVVQQLRVGHDGELDDLVAVLAAELASARLGVEGDEFAPRPLHPVGRDDDLAGDDLEQRLRWWLGADGEQGESQGNEAFHRWVPCAYGYSRSSLGRSSTFHVAAQRRTTRFGR